MSYVLLKRVSVANAAPAPGFSVSYWQYDTELRRRYTDLVNEPTNPGNFELAVGALVAAFCVNSTQRQVRYAGDGLISTHDAPNAPACAGGISNLVVTSSGLRNAYSHDAQLTVGWTGDSSEVVVRVGLMQPGRAETKPFYEERTIAAGTRGLLHFPAELGVVTLPPVTRGGRTARGGDALFESRLAKTNPSSGLGPGRYHVQVTESATGATIAGEITIDTAPADPATVALYRDEAHTGSTNPTLTLVNGPLTIQGRKKPQGNLVLLEIPVAYTAGARLLQLIVTPIDDNTAQVDAAFYQPSPPALVTGKLTVTNNAIGSAVPLISKALPALTYTLPAGTPIAPNTVSNGQGGYEVLSGQTYLELDNLIIFHPGRPQDTGGVIVELHGGDLVTPTTFELLSGTTVLQNNQHGRFGGLAAGTYRWRANQNGVAATGDFTLVAEYGLKYRLSFSDKYGAPCRVELWVRGYVGEVIILTGQGDGGGSVSIGSEGLSGGNTESDLPDSIGSAATIRLFGALGEFQQLITDDRACRADIYYRDEMEFTGFVQPEFTPQALLSGTPPIELTATCGLAALKDFDFSGINGQELRGRRPRLHTLLHCLSTTGLSLPVGIFTNLVPAELTSDETPELGIYTERLGYSDDGQPWDQRAVVDALARSLGGRLLQRGGRWEILSEMEAAKAVTGRVYSAAGTSVSVTTIPAPSARLLDENRATAAYAAQPTPRTVLYWLKRSQQQQRRPGWRYYAAVADALFAENALRPGDYFSQAKFWDESQTVLRADSGWRVGPGGFELALVEAGGESDELATSWPLTYSSIDRRYLECELAPLAAGREGLPYEIGITAKLLAHPNQQATLWAEILYEKDGIADTGAVLTFKTVASLSDGFTTVTALLPFSLLPGGVRPRLRLHAAILSPTFRTRGGDLYGAALLVQQVGVQVRPQAAQWDGADSFVARGGLGGSVRPGSPLSVVHVDNPARAGFFDGNAAAFLRTVTRGLAQATTLWARADDLAPAPLLGVPVLDTLALRSNPSLLHTGTVRHLGHPPRLFDTVDAPYDPPARRWLIGSRIYHMRRAETEVSLIEIGEGENPTYLLPNRARILDGRPGGRLRVRGTDRGIRIIQP